MGHSLGGLVVQQLLDQGLGAAGVAFCSMPPKSISLRSSILPRLWRRFLQDPINAGRAIRLSLEEFCRSFANSLNSNDAHEMFERIVLPAPGRTVFELALANAQNRNETQVSFTRSMRPPLLLVGGENDRLVPPDVVRAMHERHVSAGSSTEMRIFAGRCHLIGLNTCDDVAEFAANWIDSLRESDLTASDRSRSCG